MTNFAEHAKLTARDCLEALVFAAVLIAGLPAAIFIGMALGS